MTGLLIFGAGNEARTRDLNLGKVALYQLSYSRFAFLITANQLLGKIKIIYGIFKLVNDDLRFDIINLLNVVLNLVFLIKT